MEEQEEVKEILDRPVRIRFGVVDMHRQMEDCRFLDWHKR